MREMGWSWAQLEETPVYVRRFCWDFLVAQRRNASQHRQEPPDDEPGGSGVVRVKR